MANTGKPQQHTPGPWRAHFYETNQRTHLGDWYFTQEPTSTSGPVRFRKVGAGNAEAAANAALIAAAPEMLEALVELAEVNIERGEVCCSSCGCSVEPSEGYCGCDPEDSTLDAVTFARRQRARAAIAKATEGATP
jgi:hypothetical protein